MQFRHRRSTALLMTLALLLLLSPAPVRASASGAYFTAINDQLMDLSYDTMPFYSNSVLYVPSRLFEGGELGLSYGRNVNLGLATLYMQGSDLDLRFDIAGQTAYDKQYNVYNGYAIEKGGVIFFPLNLVCRYFGLSWSYNETDTIPLIRVKSSAVILSDSRFLNAAKTLMQTRYDDFVRAQSQAQPQPQPSYPGSTGAAPEPEPPPEPPVQAAEGQKVYLIFDGGSAPDVLSALKDTQATFLLTAEELTDGDLARALTAQGHAVALRIEGETPEEVESELQKGREALWQAACFWLELAWYDGRTDFSSLLESQGVVRVRAGIDGSGVPPAELLRSTGQHREDVAVYWGGEGRPDELAEFVDMLAEARYHLSAWRLTA